MAESAPLQPIGLQQAIDLLTRIRDTAGSGRDSMTLSVMVFNPGTVGGTPRVPVVGMTAGFDWDRGALLLQPEKPLTTLTPQQLSDISESVRKGQSWHAYEAQKKLRDRIVELERQLAEGKQVADERSSSDPFATGSADELNRLLADAIKQFSAEPPYWNDHCFGLVACVAQVLCFMRDREGLRLDAETLLSHLRFDKLYALYQRRDDFPAPLGVELQGRVQWLPGFEEARGAEQSEHTLRVHGFMQAHLTRILKQAHLTR